MNPSQTFQLQMQALREALERSARATLLAEEHTVRALSDLQVERFRARELEKEVSRLTQRHALLLSENRRLRTLVGEACQDRSSLSNELKAMLKEFEDFSASAEASPGAPTSPENRCWASWARSRPATETVQPGKAMPAAVTVEPAAKPRSAGELILAVGAALSNCTTTVVLRDCSLPAENQSSCVPSLSVPAGKA